MVASAVAAVVAPSVAVAAPVAVAVVAVVAASAADGDKLPLPASPKGRRCLTGFPKGGDSKRKPSLTPRGEEKVK